MSNRKTIAKPNKSDVKRRNTLGCIYQYVCPWLRLWNSWDCEAVLVCKYVHMMETMKQSGVYFRSWWECKFWLLRWIWHWRSRPIVLQKYSDLNLYIVHIWSKFGDPSLKAWWVIVRTNSKWGKFGFWPHIWPRRSRSIAPQNDRDLNQIVLHIWSKFEDRSLNGFWVIARTSK